MPMKNRFISRKDLEIFKRLQKSLYKNSSLDISILFDSLIKNIKNLFLKKKIKKLLEKIY